MWRREVEVSGTTKWFERGGMFNGCLRASLRSVIDKIGRFAKPMMIQPGQSYTAPDKMDEVFEDIGRRKKLALEKLSWAPSPGTIVHPATTSISSIRLP